MLVRSALLAEYIFSYGSVLRGYTTLAKGQSRVRHNKNKMSRLPQCRILVRVSFCPHLGPLGSRKPTVGV